MVPATGSVAWKRRVLRQQAAIEDTNALYSRFKANQALSPLEVEIHTECAAEAEYLALVARAVADALWPPERGLDLAPVVAAALHDGGA